MIDLCRVVGLCKLFEDLTINIEDNLQMEMKCTSHSSQMVTNVDDGPGEKKMLKESYS
ncbi:hypothetical protein RchiOBHm_Chr4g0385001 [Rosa chinensis]|uniref:Uncharacterized protein n=1 Tax=Rosa chinensis TaxID=74649 RepID=A0A2P6QNW8_ROSCH|nr:hypothetical protein RchiOBHm_Chr4g0385001 [Rosa chinensis]